MTTQEQVVENGVSQVKWILGVASGKGGVGKSTVSAHLATALAAQGLKVGLLDADIYGPSQGLMFGIADGVRPRTEGQKLYPIEAHGVQTMSMAYLVTEQTPMVWRGPMASGALQQLLLQTQWGALDILLVDLPPGTGDIQLTLSQRAKLAGAVVVTTPQDIAILDAKKALEMFAKVHVPVLGFIENMGYHECTSCGHQDQIFGSGGAAALEQRYGVPVLAQLPLTGRLREAGDAGQPLIGDDPIAALLRKASEDIVAALEQTGHDAPVIEDVDE